MLHQKLDWGDTMSKKKSKGQFSKAIVGFIIAANIIFTVAVLWVFLKTSAEPVTLIGSWFAFTTVELWQLATIKKSKVIKDTGRDDQNDS